MNKTSIAVYGGTFAPVHNGHLAAIKALAEKTDIGRIYVTPTNIPPHKRVDFNDDPVHRVNMLRLAADSVPEIRDRIIISDCELRREGPSYTYLTLTYFYENVSDDITFLCGGDMFATLEKWKNAEIIFRLARIAYVCRPGFDLSGLAERYAVLFGARVLPLEMDPVECSSTEIRRLAAAGEDVSGMTPPAVAEYIRENKLYQNI